MRSRRRLSAPLTWLGAAVVVAVPGVAPAQSLRVTLRDSLSGAPVAAALVAAEGTDGRTLVERLSAGDGTTLLRLPSAGSVQLRVRRIGVVPARSPVITVGAGETRTVELRLARTRQPLPTVAVGERCGNAASDSRAMVLWEQLVIALRSSELRRGDAAAARTTIESRTRIRLLTRSLEIVDDSASPIVVGTGARFIANDRDSLLRAGYVRRERGGILAFYAPDDAILASDEFRATHCFSVPKRDTAAGLAEVRFAPARWRTISDIAGSAWVDTATGEPRLVRFRFVPGKVTLPAAAPAAGGEVELRRLDDGTWIVGRWAIRAPLFTRNELTGDMFLRGYREFAGEAAPTLPRDTPHAVAAEWAPPAPPRRVGLALALVDREDGEGLPGVLVRTDHGDEAVSDAHGLARLALPPDTSTTLEVRKTSHVPVYTLLRVGRRDTLFVVKLRRLPTGPRR